MDKVNNIKVNSMHRDIMWRDLRGDKHRDISKVLGISESHISLLFKKKDGEWVNSLFGEEYDKMRKDLYALKLKGEGGKLQMDSVKARIDGAALDSVDTLIRLRGSADSERVRQISAMDLLDRAGFKAPEKFAGKIGVELSEEKGGRVAKALQEMRK